MDTGAWIDAAVAAGTLALAGATYWMAKATRDMAKTAQRQFDFAVTPVLRVARLGQVNEADICIVHGTMGESLTVVVENHGPVGAEVEHCSLHKFGEGEVVDPDKRFSPVLEPGESRDFDFPLSDKGLKAMKDRERTVLRIRYMAVSTGNRYRVITHLACAPEQEIWGVLGEEAPRRLD
jgi:hypothetical protein